MAAKTAPEAGATVPPHPLRLARKERGWTQEELAKKAGLTRRTVILVEQRKEPMVSTAIALAAAVGKTVEELWGSADRREGV